MVVVIPASKKLAPPEGTRYVLPALEQQRQALIDKLKQLYDTWGYQRIDMPVLEHYDPEHPAAEKSFKLSDRDSGVLALRADFTPAVARLVQQRSDAPASDRPQRYQYCGKLWQAIDPDMARTREYTQIGLELIGVSNARADAELIHLARESVREVGLVPRVEVGNPGFVRSLFSLAELPLPLQASLAHAIDRKDSSAVHSLLSDLRLAPDMHRALVSVADLYGHIEVIAEARQLAPWPETCDELDRLEAILAEFEDNSELLLDLGMARRLSYYTGVTFRAYTFDFGQPLLGGGRYDGALLPYAAGFALGLERIVSALPTWLKQPKALVLSLDDVGARRLRQQGHAVERALSADVAVLRRYALEQGIPFLLSKAGLEALVPNHPLQALLEQQLAAA